MKIRIRKRLCKRSASFALVLLLAAPRLFPGERDGGALSFAEAGQRAVENSAELRYRSAALAVQEGAWVLGRRAFLPRLTFSAFEDDRLSMFAPDSFQKNFTLGLEQLVFDGGRLRTARKIEKAKLAAAAAQLESERGDVFEAALAAYREILLLRETHEIRLHALTGLEKQRRVMETRRELGMALKAEIAEFDLSLMETRITLQQAALELEEAEARFAQMLGEKTLPPLAEKIDVARPARAMDALTARNTALERNDQLEAARLGIKEKEVEAKYAARSWIPSLKANGAFTLRGERYPLTQHSWSIGLTLEFETPFLSGSAGGAAGFEGRDTKTARLQTSVQPLPNPAAYPLSHEPKLALALLRERYALLFESLGRSAELAAEQCRMSDKRRELAIEAARLADEKLSLAELRFELGQLTLVELLEIQNERTQKHIAAAAAAAALLSAERALEKLLNLPPL
jgi:outer membrane protein TolC